MKTITVISEGSRKFNSIVNGEVKGSLVYPKWYSSNPEIWLGKDGPYIFKAQNFWHTKYSLTKDDRPLFDMQSKWNSSTVISPVKETHHQFVFRAKSMFSLCNTLVNYKGEELLEIRSDYSWKKFTQGYAITCADDFGSTEQEQLLILLSLHYFRVMQNAAASVAAST
ncbi:hypothetical protein AAEO56_12400 [Flavobacterium sp. DGU11]|uniref:Uncharacterized protein n=1 Tax=Flavobacterium arundinis TaxID=3139143 RepID=A0ABU9HY27_9FLAO